MKKWMLCICLLAFAASGWAGDREREIDELHEVLEKLEHKLVEAREKGREREVAELEEALEAHRHEIKELKEALEKEHHVREHHEEERCELDELIEEIAHHRKLAIRAMRDGRQEEAREFWLRADRMDEELRHSLENKKRPERHKRPDREERPEPGIDAFMHRIKQLYEKAHEARERDQWDVAEKCFHHVFETLHAMAERFPDPEPREMVMDQARRLFKGVELLHKADRHEQAEKLGHALEKFVHALKEKQPRKRERPEPAPEKLEHLMHRLEEMKAVEKELAHHAEAMEKRLARINKEQSHIIHEMDDQSMEKWPKKVHEALEKLEAKEHDIAVELRHIQKKRAEVAAERKEIQAMLHGKTFQAVPVRKPHHDDEEKEALWQEIKNLKHEIHELKALLREALKR